MSNAQPDSTPREEPSTAELAVLREENERLRAEYRRARHHQYRRSARALGAIGVLAVLAAAVLPGVRDVLVVVGAIGVFGGVLTYYVTPERVTTASVVESVHDAHAATVTALVEELGLQDDRVYVPVDDPREDARLFVPQHANYALPDDRTRLFTVSDAEAERGVCLVPVGRTLLDSLEPAVPDVATPDDALTVATDAVTDQFELAGHAEAEVAEGRATVSVSDVRPRDLGSAEHPVVSLCGVALAVALETPVTVADRDTEHVTFTWSS